MISSAGALRGGYTWRFDQPDRYTMGRCKVYGLADEVQGRGRWVVVHEFDAVGSECARRFAEEWVGLVYEKLSAAGFVC